MSILDLRDVYNEKESEPETYKLWFEALGFDTDEEFLEQANNEPTMIPEDEFEDYAQELAEDLGLISDNMAWPSNCINWEEAASELRSDYTEVEVDGITYLYR